MSNKRYTEEFKVEAVKQMTERGHLVTEMANRLGVSQHRLYALIKRYRSAPAERTEARSQQEEVRRLHVELERVTDERDILKGRSIPKGDFPWGILCQETPVRYAFILTHEEQHPVRRKCRMMAPHPCGYNAWRAEPMSVREKENQRQVYENGIGVVTGSYVPKADKRI